MDWSQYDYIQNPELIKNAYESLSDEAKAIFDIFLTQDEELLNLHKKYVDSSYEIVDIPVILSASDAVTIVTEGLAALNLPNDVVYCLKMLASGMVASIADGALPIGDILLVAATVSAAVIIAQNWYDVVAEWDNILAVFNDAFAAFKSNVTSAFSTIKSDINVEAAARVTVNGRNVYVDGTLFVCSEKAEEIARSLPNGSYFPAVLFGQVLYLCPVDIQRELAKAIIVANNAIVGVWATSESAAKGICVSNPIWHSVHKSEEGYFYHYHHRVFSNSHAWYL